MRILLQVWIAEVTHTGVYIQKKTKYIQAVKPHDRFGQQQYLFFKSYTAKTFSHNFFISRLRTVFYIPFNLWDLYGSHEGDPTV